MLHRVIFFSLKYVFKSTALVNQPRITSRVVLYFYCRSNIRKVHVCFLFYITQQDGSVVKYSQLAIKQIRRKHSIFPGLSVTLFSEQSTRF